MTTVQRTGTLPAEIEAEVPGGVPAAPLTPCRAPGTVGGVARGGTLEQIVDRQDAEALEPTACEVSYFRHIFIGSALGVVVMFVLLTGAALAVGASELGVGACVVIGLFGGIWTAPIAGVLAIGRWARRMD